MGLMIDGAARVCVYRVNCAGVLGRAVVLRCPRAAAAAAAAAIVYCRNAMHAAASQ